MSGRVSGGAFLVVVVLRDTFPSSRLGILGYETGERPELGDSTTGDRLSCLSNAATAASIGLKPLLLLPLLLLSGESSDEVEMVVMPLSVEVIRGRVRDRVEVGWMIDERRWLGFVEKRGFGTDDLLDVGVAGGITVATARMVCGTGEVGVTALRGSVMLKVTTDERLAGDDASTIFLGVSVTLKETTDERLAEDDASTIFLGGPADLGGCTTARIVSSGDTGCAVLGDSAGFGESPPDCFAFGCVNITAVATPTPKPTPAAPAEYWGPAVIGVTASSSAIWDARLGSPRTQLPCLSAT